MSAHMNNEHSFELYKNTNEKVIWWKNNE